MQLHKVSFAPSAFNRNPNKAQPAPSRVWFGEGEIDINKQEPVNTEEPTHIRFRRPLNLIRGLRLFRSYKKRPFKIEPGPKDHEKIPLFRILPSPPKIIKKKLFSLWTDDEKAP